MQSGDKMDAEEIISQSGSFPNELVDSDHDILASDDEEVTQISNSDGSSVNTLYKTKSGRVIFYESFIEQAKLRSMNMESFKGFIDIIGLESAEDIKVVFHKYMVDQLLPILPVKANSNGDWMTVFEKLQEMCLKVQGLSLHDMEIAFLKCAIKLGRSFGKASQFWSNFRRHYILMKDHGILSELECKRKIIAMFKKQFKYGYLGVGRDFELAMEYLKNKNWLDRDNKLMFQGLFYEKASGEEALIEMYPEFSESNLLHHHTEFENFIWGLIQNKETPQYELIQVLCEEMICTEPSSPCWYWVYISVLENEFIQSTMSNYKEVLTNLLRRASVHINFEQGSCFALHARFWEMALLVASQVLTSDVVEDLIKEILKSITWKFSGGSRCFHARKAILMSTKYLINKGVWQNDKLEKMFKECLSPVTEDVYRRFDYISPFDVGFPFELTEYFLDLLTVYVQLNAKLFNQTLEDMITTWEAYFVSQCDTFMMLRYTDFIRLHGTENHIRKAFEQALFQVVPRMNDYNQRHGFMALMKNQLEFLSENGPLADYIHAQKKYINTHCTYAFDYCEYYETDHPPPKQIKIQIESLPSCSKDEDKSSSQPSSQSNSQNSLSEKMEEMELLNGKPKPSKPYYGKGYPLFIINLNYVTTSKQLEEAFVKINYRVVRVEMKRNKKGQNPGYGTIFLDSEESVNDAIKRYNGILTVDGRILTLEAHNKGKSTVRRTPLYDSILLEGVPMAQFDELKISSVLEPHGSLMSLTMMNPTNDPAYCRVLIRYHLLGDLEATYKLWQEGKVFAHTGIKMSKTKAGKWGELEPRQVTTERGRSPKAGSKRPFATAKKQGKPALPAASNRPHSTLVAFVPAQVRRTQTRRLEVPIHQVNPTPASPTKKMGDGCPELLDLPSTSAGNDVAMLPTDHDNSGKPDVPVPEESVDLSQPDVQNMSSGTEDSGNSSPPTKRMLLTQEEIKKH